MNPSVVALALASAYVTKVLVDMFRLSGNDSVKHWSAAIALAVGIVAAIVVNLANGVVLSTVVLAQSALAGVLAAGSAVGATELQKLTNKE